jgi:hypothetical protein
VPLVLDPERLPRSVLEQLRSDLRKDLSETLESVRHPRGKVLDPASLETAADLLHSAAVLLDRPGDRELELLGAEANLAYAALLATIDLVKTHTEVPRVPRARGVSPPSPEP